MTKPARIRQNVKIACMSVLVIAGFSMTLSACSMGGQFDNLDLSASEAAQARGFPNLQPISFFAAAPPRPNNIGNIASRAASLRGNIRALSRPVLSPRDRSRLEAAIARNVAGR